MRSLSFVRRALMAAVAATAMLVVGGAPAAAETAPSTRVPFFAEHERGCWYMVTEGTLDFTGIWGSPQRVDVRGRLAETMIQYGPPCSSGENTFAEFVAYITYDGESQEVDRETVYLHDPTGPADPVVRSFEFSLVNTSPLPDIPIDRVDVRVCRDFGPWLPAFTCGTTQTYP